LKKKATLERCSHNISQTPKLLEIFPIAENTEHPQPTNNKKYNTNFHSTKDKNQKREKRIMYQYEVL